MTKLEAINDLLDRVGSLPIGALQTGTSSIGGMAERTFDKTDQEIQRSGWHFNTYRDVTRAPDVSNYIDLPTGVLWFEPVGADAWRKLKVDGVRIYDLDNNTDEFTASLLLNEIRLLTFADLPGHAQQHILAEAAMRFYNRHFAKQTDRATRGLLVRDLDRTRMRALREFESLDAEQSGMNVFGNRGAIETVGRRRGVSVYGVSNAYL